MLLGECGEAFEVGEESTVTSLSDLSRESAPKRSSCHSRWAPDGDQRESDEHQHVPFPSTRSASCGRPPPRPSGWPRFRVGLNTGGASAGVLGSLVGGRTYSVVGDTVNLASRIEGFAPAGGVAIGAATASRLWGAQLEPLGKVEIKGREEPVAVFLLLRLPG